jgi:hypothetical protein
MNIQAGMIGEPHVTRRAHDLLRHPRAFQVGGASRGRVSLGCFPASRRMLAEPFRQRLQVLLASAAEQVRELPPIDRRNRARFGWQRRPTPPGPSHPAKNDARFPHLTSDAEASFWPIGETGEPGPIFCRLPVITRSVSTRPFTLTASPSDGPSVTIFCSALLPSPTT